MDSDLEKIAVDAMGAEKGISIVVNGAIGASEIYGCDIILVGDKEKINKELKNKKYNISVEDSSKPISRGLDMVLADKAGAFVSPGNTNKIMSLLLKKLKEKNGWECIKEDSSPVPLVVRLPARDGKHYLMGDVGAITDPVPERIVEYGIMLSALAEKVFEIKNPRVANFNIGEEDGKGNKLAREAHKLFKRLKEHGFNYAGNKEPEHLFNGEVDCVACAGFVGNSYLKTIESTASFVKEELKREYFTPWRFALSVPGILGNFLTYQTVRKKFNRSNYGGAIVLGLKHVIVVTHSSSDATAIRESIRVAKEYAEHDTSKIIIERIAQYKGVLAD